MLLKFRPFYLLATFLLLHAACAMAQTKKPVPKKTGPAAPVTKSVTKKPVVIQKLTNVRIKISTDSGNIIVKLSDSTPLHRDNMVKLIKQGFYDSLLFHRVIPQFMIQGGDPGSKYAASGTMLGSGGDTMARIPAEFNTALYHKKGVLAAARDGNPQKASSACQFYLVEGKLYTDEQLNIQELQKGIKYTPEQRKMYTTVGGTPQLDAAYTVFGEIESGVEVIAKISGVPRDGANRPLGDIRMRMEILK